MFDSTPLLRSRYSRSFEASRVSCVELLIAPSVPPPSTTHGASCAPTGAIATMPLTSITQRILIMISFLVSAQEEPAFAAGCIGTVDRAVAVDAGAGNEA